MKRLILCLILFSLQFLTLHLSAQEEPLKVRPDALPWEKEITPKAISMATSIEQMANWDRYPTYNTYLSMMEQWATEFPNLCHIDTIGTSVQGRLILSMYIEPETDDDLYRPEFFYSSTMHGDEVTGFVMMLRLIDTLLHGYGSNPQYTNLINRLRISINPLSNPDGTYHGGNNTVSGAWRYNANYVDLNRNYPDPFGSTPDDDQQVENTAMINYVSNHNFRVSANLHGGAEVMNYPWDSYRSSQNPHPDRDWWIEVCKRFIDTSRTYSNSHFRDTYNSGYTAGGDWYVISNGRQDYMNYYHNCREMTMEISSNKTLSSNQLPEYWRFLQHSLVNYIEETLIFASGDPSAINPATEREFSVYPNPTSDRIFLNVPPSNDITIYDIHGKSMMQLQKGTQCIDIRQLPKGIYILKSGDTATKVVKQ